MTVQTLPGGEPDRRRSTAIALLSVGAGLAFAIVLGFLKGPIAAQQYGAAYLVELSLSVDNLLLFIVIFEHFRIEPRFQRRALTWGLWGAAILRVAFILAGIRILARFEWVLFVFGIWIFATGVRLTRSAHPEGQIPGGPAGALRILRRLMPVSAEPTGPRFFVSEGGRRLATPLFAALIALEAADFLFALDSLPAVLAITRDPLIAISSNLFAIVGLRSLYGVLRGALGRWRHLRPGLSAVLIFIGLKMIAQPWYSLSSGVSLAVIASILGISVLASPRKGPPQAP